MDYKTEKVNITLETKPGFYFLFKPFRVNYRKFNEEKENKDAAIWEKAAFIGRGWIGAESKNGNKKIEGEFKTYVHTGKYSDLAGVYKTIMKENPKAREFYSVYLNNPEQVGEDETQTKIVFR